MRLGGTCKADNVRGLVEEPPTPDPKADNTCDLVEEFSASKFGARVKAAEASSCAHNNERSRESASPR